MLPVTKYNLEKHGLDEICHSFEQSLSNNYEEYRVEIIDCPDLTAAPWNLALPGQNGTPCVADVGGVPNLIPLVNVDKQYNLDTVAELCEMPGGFVIGPSAVASKLMGKNAELVNNVKTGKEGVVRSMSTKIINDERNEYECKSYPYNEFGLLGNLFLCQGHPGKVIHVTAKKRTGSLNFINCLNKGLGENFADPIAVGGTFLLTNGKAKLHVMPGFSCAPLNTEDDINHWLRFFEMSGPLTHTSVFVSKDPGLDLRLEHSHCFSEHGDGGHYHFDTTPDTVCYEGYFNLAEAIFRVDPPKVTHMIGRD